MNDEKLVFIVIVVITLVAVQVMIVVIIMVMAVTAMAQIDYNWRVVIVITPAMPVTVPPMTAVAIIINLDDIAPNVGCLDTWGRDRISRSCKKRGNDEPG
jgi:hypothetical protein